MSKNVLDAINAGFELCGGFAYVPTLLMAWRARRVVGYHLSTTAFFWSWGVWNLFWYRNLDQPFSFWCGAFLLFMSSIWFLTVIKLGEKE
jgi:hypothetical protein